jgi:hypothetical protein
MIAYWIELRRSPLRWWLGPLIIIDLVVLFFGRGHWWIGIWPEASVATQVPAYYFGPLFAAVAAFTVGRPTRKSFDQDRTPQAQSRFLSETIHFLATLTFALIPYGIGVAVAYGVSFRQAGPGGLWPAYITIGAILLTGCAAAGHFVGRMLPGSMATPVVCGVGCFLVVAVLGQSAGLLVLNGYPSLQPRTSAITSRAFLAFLLAAAAIIVSAQRHRSFASTLERTITTFVAAGVLLIGFSFTAHAGSVQQDRAPTTNMTCTVGSHQFCIWPEHQKFLPVFQQMTVRLDQVPEILAAAEQTSYEQGLRGHEYEGHDFSLLEGQPFQAAFGVALQSDFHVPTKLCPLPTPELEAQRSDLLWRLTAWLTVRVYGAGQPSGIHGGISDAMNEVVPLTQQPDDVQAAWVDARKTDITAFHCA